MAMFLLIPLLLPFIAEAADGNIGFAPVCPNQNGDCLAENDVCGLYLAESTVYPGSLAVFTGLERASRTKIEDDDLVLSVVDSNQNEYSPWHDLIWGASYVKDALLENKYLHELLLGGISSVAPCGGASFSNVAPVWTTASEQDTYGVHRSKDPTAGSFNYRKGPEVIATQRLMAGDELFLECNDERSDEIQEAEFDTNRSLEWLQKNGVCIDGLVIRQSTLPSVGRGAFAKRAVAPGQVVLSSPMLHFDRSQLEIVHQEYKPEHEHTIPFARDHGIEYTEKVVGYQLLRNYCYGRADSNVMLLPIAPGANFINHHSEKANVYIRWSEKFEDYGHLQTVPVMELFETTLGEEGTFVMEYVALRAISPGEEIFLDYGKEWTEAWQKHVSQWTPGDAQYISAAEYNKLHPGEPIRTEAEQAENPYPANVRTACYYEYNRFELMLGDTYPYRALSPLKCLRPCDIKTRTGDSFTAIVHPGDNLGISTECGYIPPGGIPVSGIPSDAIALVDQPYTTDKYISGAFRHEIGVPETFYPENWLAADSNPFGDFIGSPLSPGMLAPIRWKGSAEVVTPWAFRIGIPNSVRETLLEYCRKTGIIDIFRHVTVKGNALLPGEQGYLNIDNLNWFLQRPGAEWRSNLHWLSPGDNGAHENYLQALSLAGFDQVLDGIGKYLDMDGIVAFHVTFIATSRSTVGYKHHDILWTGAKTFNIIVPLILANETGPELDLQQDPSYQKGYDKEDHQVGRYRYEYDVASMMGDGAVHATSAVDYRQGKEMRLAATIYISDVNEDNADSILKEYTQAYPPDDRDLLLSWAGRHWKKDDPTVKLPKPDANHILLRSDKVASA